MSIKVVSRIFEDESPLVITTHGGDFNLDDVLSMSIFCMTSYRNKVIIRNDDKKYASGIMFDTIVKCEQCKYQDKRISKTEAVWILYGERIVKRVLLSCRETTSIVCSEDKIKKLADIVCQKAFKNIGRSNDDPNYIPSVYSYFDVFMAEGRNDYDSIFEKLLDYNMYYLRDEVISKIVFENLHKV